MPIKVIKTSDVDDFNTNINKLHEVCSTNKAYTSEQYCGKDLISVNDEILIPYLSNFNKEIDTLNMDWTSVDVDYIKKNEI